MHTHIPCPPAAAVSVASHEFIFSAMEEMPRKAVARFWASPADFWADFSAAQALPVDAAITFMINVTGRGFDAAAVGIQGCYDMNGMVLVVIARHRRASRAGQIFRMS